VIARLMGLPTISPQDLHRLTLDGKAVVIDVNAPAVWDDAHVPGAANLDPVTYDAAALPADKAALIVFYCSNPLCSKAPKAAKRALRLGHENVRVMSAGISGWLSARLPTESRAGASSTAASGDQGR
jgi:rhodanese-related sulfurtransferase